MYYVSVCGHTQCVDLCSKQQYRQHTFIMWLYYACSYIAALSPGLILSLAVVHTEKHSF